MADNPSDLFVDLSSNNPLPSRRRLRRHYKAGRRVLVLKVSQGTGYAWADSHTLSDIWHSLGGRVGHYHWTSPGGSASGTEQANYFWSHVQHDLADGDLLIEDLEQQGATEAEHAAFQARLATLVRASKLKAITRWTYSGAYFLREIGAKHHGTRWWGAGYPSLPFIPAGWTLAAHQYTDKASAPGLAGSLDQSRLLIPLTPPAPKPTPTKTKQLGTVTRFGVHWLTGRLAKADKRAGKLDAGDRNSLHDLGAQMLRLTDSPGK